MKVEAVDGSRFGSLTDFIILRLLMPCNSFMVEPATNRQCLRVECLLVFFVCIREGPNAYLAYSVNALRSSALDALGRTAEMSAITSRSAADRKSFCHGKIKHGSVCRWRCNLLNGCAICIINDKVKCVSDCHVKALAVPIKFIPHLRMSMSLFVRTELMTAAIAKKRHRSVFDMLVVLCSD